MGRRKEIVYSQDNEKDLTETGDWSLEKIVHSSLIVAVRVASRVSQTTGESCPVFFCKRSALICTNELNGIKNGRDRANVVSSKGRHRQELATSVFCYNENEGRREAVTRRLWDQRVSYCVYHVYITFFLSS